MARKHYQNRDSRETNVNALWKKAIDNLSDGVVICDNDFNIIHANNAFHKITGHKKKQNNNQKTYLSLHGKDSCEECPTCNAIKYKKSAKRDIHYEPYLNK